MIFVQTSLRADEQRVAAAGPCFPPPRSLQKTVAARHLSNCGKAAELSEPEAGVVAYSLFQIFS